jgi:hypothetical protein
MEFSEVRQELIEDSLQPAIILRVRKAPKKGRSTDPWRLATREMMALTPMTVATLIMDDTTTR